MIGSSTLVFKTKELRRCVEHALNAPAHHMGRADVPRGPALFLVHDDGVYLMSNGEPVDLRNKDELGAYVAYAEHCNPDKDSDCWENSRELVGGDDFAETIAIDANWLKKCDTHDELRITIDADTMISMFYKKESATV